MTRRFIIGCLYFFFMWTFANSIRGRAIEPFSRDWCTEMWIFACTLLGVTYL